MVQPGWSSLPVDLVNRVADCLLATNDLDYYTNLRAVCHHWRSVTADPGSNQHDPRFRPNRWVMLDDHKVSPTTIGDGAIVVFVNTATGRFLRRRLPLLHDRDNDSDYVFVTSTTGGLIVLAVREPPHAVSVLNLFTGSMIRFAAPLPSELGPRLRLTADVVGSSPTLVLISIGSSWVYWADPQSGSFSVETTHGNRPASRLPQIAAAINGESVKNIFDQLQSEKAERCRCYAVELPGGDMLAVLKWCRGLHVFKIDAAGNVMEKVKSIGSLALFLGVRCFVVDTDFFPTVEANCAYFELTDPGMDRCYTYIHKFTIGIYEDEEPEFVSAAVDDYLLRPWTLTQLLVNYTMTMDIPSQPLTWKMCLNYFGADCYGNYINYIDYGDDESDDLYCPFFDDFL